MAKSRAPSRPVAFAPQLQLARQRWAGLSQRERRLLQLAAGLCALLLLWSVLLQPALRTRRQAPAEIAALQGALEQARQQAQQLVELRRLPAVAAAPDLMAAATLWMSRHQQSAAALPLASGVRLQLRQLPAAQLLELAGAARRDWGAEIGAADLQLDAAQRVSGSVDLVRRAAARP